MDNEMNDRQRVILTDKQVLCLINDSSKDEVAKRRNKNVMKQCQNLFDKGHRCVLIKELNPLYYTWCGHTPVCLEVVQKQNKEEEKD